VFLYKGQGAFSSLEKKKKGIKNAAILPEREINRLFSQSYGWQDCLL
jgi:hypothetical protein